MEEPIDTKDKNVKPQRKKRESWLKIRISPVDRYFIKQRAEKANLTVSDYVRFCTIGAQSATMLPNAEVLAEVKAEIQMFNKTVSQAVRLSHAAAKDGTITLNHMKSLCQTFHLCGQAIDQLERTIIDSVRRRPS